MVEEAMKQQQQKSQEWAEKEKNGDDLTEIHRLKNGLYENCHKPKRTTCVHSHSINYMFKSTYLLTKREFP